MPTVITIYGTSWCGNSRRVRLLLDQRKIPYQFIDIDTDPQAAAFVERVNHGNRSVPTILFLDGSTLTEPSEGELFEKLKIA